MGPGSGASRESGVVTPPDPEGLRKRERRKSRWDGDGDCVLRMEDVRHIHAPHAVRYSTVHTVPVSTLAAKG